MLDPLRCSCSNLRRASRHITRAYDKLLTGSGLRISQFHLLRIIDAFGPTRMQAVAREMGLDRTTLGRNLKPLERDGLVAIDVDDRDRRGRRLTLTEKGRARLASARPLWQAAQTRFEQAYAPEDLLAFDNLMLAISALRFGKT